MRPIKIGTFAHIARWGSAAAGSTFDEVRVAAEDRLTEALRHLFALAEEHPQLRASFEFQSLEQALEAVEESLRKAWRDYNAAVRDYNQRIEVFPGKLLAGLLGFQPRPSLERARFASAPAQE